MGSNFKKSWSFWGGRKRFDHQFNNSFTDDFEEPRIRLEDRFQNPAYERNQFQTRSLRYDRRNMITQNDQYFNSSMDNDLEHRQRAHSRWSKSIQRSLGFEKLISPRHTCIAQGSAYSNQEPRRPPLLKTPMTPKMYNNPHNDMYHCDEPIYENLKSFQNDRLAALLPTPMDSPSVMPLHFPEDEEMDMTPELPPRNGPQLRENVSHNRPQAEQTVQRGGTKFNKAFQGVCTSMRTFSQRFRKKTKRHYQLEGSPCTPRMMTPGKNLYPFDLSTPITPHSYKRGTKRLQGSARRQLLGKENLGISRTPSHFHNTKTNWEYFSPMKFPNGKYMPH